MGKEVRLGEWQIRTQPDLNSIQKSLPLDAGVIKKNAGIDYRDLLMKASAEVEEEVLRAKTIFKNNFYNQHEAYAVIKEELDELWDEIKLNQKTYDIKKQRKEAVQLAAMVIRFIVELT